jgi:deoxyribonuclease V
VLRKVTEPLTTVVIDGYVWLGTDKSPGLGAHLFRALDEQIPVIGVAKSRFKDSTYAYKAFRGYSKRPLYITAAGIDPEVATKNISHMHGKFRIPTLLKKVDFLCQSSKGVTPL